MDLKLKEIVIIEFLAKEGCAHKEIYDRLKNVYGRTVMDISNIRPWMKKFENAEMEISDKLRNGRLTKASKDVNRARTDEWI